MHARVCVCMRVCVYACTCVSVCVHVCQAENEKGRGRGENPCTNRTISWKTITRKYKQNKQQKQAKSWQCSPYL